MARTKSIQPKKRAFLAAYAEVGNISAACRLADVSRKCHYKWLAKDTDYAAAFEEAGEQAADALESEARRRAVEGTDEPVYYKGAPVGAIRKYSDTLLIFLLKAARPEKFRDNHYHEVTGKDGADLIPIQAVDYRLAIAALAPGSVGDSDAPGADQDPSDGASLGQDGTGG